MPTLLTSTSIGTSTGTGTSTSTNATSAGWTTPTTPTYPSLARTTPMQANEGPQQATQANVGPQHQRRSPPSLLANASRGWGCPSPTDHLLPPHPPRSQTRAKGGVFLTNQQPATTIPARFTHPEAHVQSVRMFHCFFWFSFTPETHVWWLIHVFLLFIYLFVFFHPWNTHMSHHTRVSFFFSFFCLFTPSRHAYKQSYACFGVLFCYTILWDTCASNRTRVPCVFFSFSLHPRDTCTCVSGFFLSYFLFYLNYDDSPPPPIWDILNFIYSEWVATHMKKDPNDVNRHLGHLVEWL